MSKLARWRMEYHNKVHQLALTLCQWLCHFADLDEQSLGSGYPWEIRLVSTRKKVFCIVLEAVWHVHRVERFYIHSAQHQSLWQSCHMNGSPPVRLVFADMEAPCQYTKLCQGLWLPFYFLSLGSVSLTQCHMGHYLWHREDLTGAS